MVVFLWWHRVGQRVVFKGDEHYAIKRQIAELQGFIVPEVGGAYTIREVLPSPSGATLSGGNTCFRLVEIVNPIGYFRDAKGEPMFGAGNFRPVRETSIESFRALLSPTPGTTRETEEAAHV